MRYKPWPYYKDWCLLFGKDRATGEFADGFEDASIDMGGSSIKRSNSIFEDPSQPPVVPPDINDSLDDSLVDSSYIDIMSKWCDKTEVCMGTIAKRIGFRHDPAAKREAVTGLLAKMEFLDVGNQLTVAKKLCENPNNLDILFSLPDDRKEVTVKMFMDIRSIVKWAE